MERKTTCPPAPLLPEEGAILTLNNYVPNNSLSIQPRSYNVVSSRPITPITPYIPQPAYPQKSLTEIVHDGSGWTSAIAAFVTLFGNDKQSDTAYQWLDVSLKIFQATNPLPPPPSTPAVQTLYITPSTLPANTSVQQRVQRLEGKESELRQMIGEACRQLAVTQGELTLLREAVFGEPDDSDDA